MTFWVRMVFFYFCQRMWVIDAKTHPPLLHTEGWQENANIITIYLVLCFPSDNVLHELQRWSLINIIFRQKKTTERLSSDNATRASSLITHKHHSQTKEENQRRPKRWTYTSSMSNCLLLPTSGLTSIYLSCCLCSFHAHFMMYRSTWTG